MSPKSGITTRTGKSWFARFAELLALGLLAGCPRAPAADPAAVALVPVDELPTPLRGRPPEAEPLPSAPGEGEYRGWRRPLGDDWGLSLQWWRYPSAEAALAAYQRRLAAAPGPELSSDTEHSYRTREPGAGYVVFVDPASRSVVALGCGARACFTTEADGWARLGPLARAVRLRLPR